MRRSLLVRLCTVLAAGAAVVALTGPAAAATAPPGTRQLQAVLDDLVANGASGALATVWNGSQVTRLVSGEAQLTPAKPLTSDASFRVGSITKTFVATVALQLVGEGRLSLADSVEQWLPGVVPNGAHITVRELMNHTSGLFDYTEDSAFLNAIITQPLKGYSPQQLLAVAFAHPPNFAPGADWSYSNTNYIVMGLLEQAVTGQPVGSLIQRRILTPLGLKHTFFPAAGQTTIPGNHEHGYLPPALTGAGYLDFTRIDPSWAWSAGAIVSNAADLHTFYTALLTGRLLKPAQLQQMQTTVTAASTLHYGLGLYQQQFTCGPVWGHDGSVPGYLTFAYDNAAGTRGVVISLPTEADARYLAPLLNLAVDTGVCAMNGVALPAAAPPAAPPGADRALAAATR